jgi:8-oxo-dGTP diphosphatase
MEQTKYVLGFLFSDDEEFCVLVQKNKPEWQAGLLNGVGGKIEDGETALAAVRREFLEETGVDTSLIEWRPFCEMFGNDWVVYCFMARDREWHKVGTTTPEKIICVSVKELRTLSCVSNLYWLVQMALDKNYGKQFYAVIDYNEPPE